VGWLDAYGVEAAHPSDDTKKSVAREQLGVHHLCKVKVMSLISLTLKKRQAEALRKVN
jgi:hypothetical protein